MYMQGETIPRESNHVRLHETKKDQWGIPLPRDIVDYDDNYERMIKDWRTQAPGCSRSRAATTSRRTTRVGHPGWTSTRWAARGWAGSEAVRPQRVEPGARLPQRVRHRRRVHDVDRQPEPLHLYMPSRRARPTHAVDLLKRREL